MKSFVALFALVAIAAADVSELRYRGPDADAQIITQEADVLPDRYQFRYETSNGIAADESGSLQNPGREDEAIAAQGSYSWISPEGIPVKVNWVADANGYQPQGDSIPVPPPIPEPILRALAWIASQPKQLEPGQRS